jgi:hypothetical protein
MMLKLWLLLFGLVLATDASAVGMTIAMYITGATLATAGIGTLAIAFAINMVVSTVISKVLYNAPSMEPAGSSPDPGNRQQVPPATDNKIPVVYGDAWLGGTIVDMSISSNNQELYYVMALCEVTNTNTGQTPDTFTFGDVYYGGKKVLFDPVFKYKVTGLLDESTGVTDTAVAGKIEIYLYRNGSNQPANSSLSAITVMSNADLIYKWDASKLMSNSVFAIVHLTYNADAGIRGIEQTRYQVKNSRFATGDCISDYLLNTRYGAALPASQINTASLSELNAYSNQSFTYTTYNGVTSTQTRFRFDGVLMTERTVMQNLQDMASCCDCVIKYNEITAQWGVIVQKPTFTVAMDINDSNIVSAIQISPTDLANTFNIAEVKFPDKSNQDAFNSSTFDLAQIEPALMFPNEPVNKQSISLPFVNDSVRAQYLANRFLKSAREDLMVDCAVNFIGIQLEAGDIVTLTNANYGWTAKLFRINKVTETFGDDGSIVCKLLLMEFNPTVYDDVAITQFTPAPNTGIGSPTTFGFVPAPVISNAQPNAAIPSFDVNVTTSTSGITQYAEVWYSAFPTPTDAQRMFAGTTAINASGQPYQPSEACPPVTLSGIPFGNWYFFSRMVNSLSSSTFSAASALINWRPITIQYKDRFLMVAYADNASGGGFSLLPTGKDWFGLSNQATSTPVSDPAAYSWYEAVPVFGTGNFLLYINRGNRKSSFGVGDADYASSTGAYVPTETATYDPTLWSALPTGVNFIDLDARTGQLLSTGTSTVAATDGLINVTNTANGLVVASLERFLNFGAGVKYKTSSAANLTVDIYGRVVGFTSPDNFFFSEVVFTASAGQTVFTIAHTLGNLLVFENGVLLDTTEYSETTANITLNTGALAGTKIVVLNMRAETTDVYYMPVHVAIASSTTNSITYDTASLPYQYIKVGDLLSFSNVGTPITYAVSAVNYTTRTITFATPIVGATVGAQVYQYRAAGTAYRPFSRYTASLTNAANYTPSEWALRSGYELLFVNGSFMSELDYDITGGQINGLPNLVTGNMTIIQFTENNLTIPCSGVGNSLATTVEGVTEYAFGSNPDAFQLYANGVILAEGTDYTATSSLYTLASAPSNSYTLLQQQTFERAGAA